MAEATPVRIWDVAIIFIYTRNLMIRSHTPYPLGHEDKYNILLLLLLLLSPRAGLEPATPRLEVLCAIHCANEAK